MAVTMAGARTPDDSELRRNAAVQSVLRVLVRVTGLRVALVAHVTPSAWTACAVLDEAGFNLTAGDQLELQNTY